MNNINLSINQFTYDALMLHIDASNLYPELTPVFNALASTSPIEHSGWIVRYIIVPYECLIHLKNYCLTYQKIYLENKNKNAIYIKNFIRQINLLVEHHNEQH